MIQLFLMSAEASTDLFLNVLNMSISALWLVLAVLLLRFALKRVPRWIHVLLWAFVAIRLVCPIRMESVLSLIPTAQTVAPEIMLSPTPSVDTGIEIINDAVNPIIQSSFTPNPAASANPLQILIPAASGLWLMGMAAMLLYTLISYAILRRKVASSTWIRGNIYLSEAVASPFVLGVIRPRIYLPAVMDNRDIPHVIAHERAHIRRKDHWWKPLGFLILTVHWFNPAIWLAYWLLCRDIELACDEKVIRELGNQQQADYSQALLNCSIHRRSIASCPLAFGEVGVKQRVRNILSYKKPAFWVIVAALVLCMVVAVCFLTDPISTAPPFGQDWYIHEFLYTIDTGYVSGNPPISLDGYPFEVTAVGHVLLRVRYNLSEDGRFSVLESDTGKMATLGTFREEHISMLNFDEYFKEDAVWHTDLYRPEKFRETCVNAWRLDVKPNGPGLFYLLTEQEDGKFYLFCGYDENTSHAAQEETSRMYWAASLTGIGNLSPSVTCWYDYPENRTYPSESDDNQALLPQFPNVTFKGTPEAVIAEGNGEINTIISGMPVWNVFLSDLTGDGIPDFCATVSYGSGIIDEHVVVYDYATKTEYTLWDRGNFDYTLRLENGKLLCDKWLYPHSGLVESGELMLVHAGGGEGLRLELRREEEKETPNSVSFRNMDFSGVTSIRLDNARNGKSTNLTDSDKIEAICNWLSTVSGSNARNSKGWHYQGSFALTLLAGEEEVLQITFGDDDLFFHGKYDDRYSIMYDLDRITIDDVIHFLYRYDDSGFDWGFEETAVAVEVSPYSITSNIPRDELQGEIEYLQPGEIIGYGFLKEERRDLGILLNDLTPAHFVTPIDYTPTMKIMLSWPGGKLTLYSDGKQTVIGEDGAWAVRSDELNRFLSRFNPQRLAGNEIVSLEEIDPYYNSEQAEIDGCVVFRNSDIRANSDKFTTFTESVTAGTPASVRLAWFSDEERFAIGVSDIVFDGESFTWQSFEDGQLYERKYQYLRHFQGEPETPNATYDAYDAYILTNEPRAGWEELWNSLYSSQAGVAIDFTIVYMDYIYYPVHPVIPECKTITLEFEDEVLLTITDTDALEALLAGAELKYKPKTYSPGPILRLTGEDGSEMIITLMLDSDWIIIDGQFLDFGPGYVEDGSRNALPELFDLLGIDNWPQAVLDAYPDFF